MPLLQTSKFLQRGNYILLFLGLRADGAPLRFGFAVAHTCAVASRPLGTAFGSPPHR
jgi:hypothetical protein